MLNWGGTYSDVPVGDVCGSSVGGGVKAGGQESNWDGVMVQVCAREAVSMAVTGGRVLNTQELGLLRQERATIKANASVGSSGTQQRAHFPGNTISVLGHLEFELYLQHVDSWQMEMSDLQDRVSA